jgi:hypothetical protein
MPDHPAYDDLQQQIADAVDGLEALAETDERPLMESVPDPTRELAVALRTTLLALSSSMGECRQAVPYEPMHLVRKADGTIVWCCTHVPPHPPDCG